MRITIYMISLLSFFACKKSNSENPEDKAQSIVNKAIEQHGGAAYKTMKAEYVFRKTTYQIHNQDTKFEYSRAFEKDGQQIKDVLTEAGFERTIDGVVTNVVDSMANLYSNSINSVHYFAQLPYHLNDDAVKKTYEGEKRIKDKTYHAIKVTFAQEGGGEDFDDVYYYWFDVEDYTLAYLAYSFEVNGGGIRFRSAYNPRVVNGIRFQDYVNYKAPKESNLADLPQLFETRQLEELSRIELENIR